MDSKKAALFVSARTNYKYYDRIKDGVKAAYIAQFGRNV